MIWNRPIDDIFYSAWFSHLSTFSKFYSLLNRFFSHPSVIKARQIVHVLNEKTKFWRSLLQPYPSTTISPYGKHFYPHNILFHSTYQKLLIFLLTFQIFRSTTKRPLTIKNCFFHWTTLMISHRLFLQFYKEYLFAKNMLHCLTKSISVLILYNFFKSICKIIEQFPKILAKLLIHPSNSESFKRY